MLCSCRMQLKAIVPSLVWLVACCRWTACSPSIATVLQRPRTTSRWEVGDVCVRATRVWAEQEFGRVSGEVGLREQSKDRKRNRSAQERVSQSARGRGNAGEFRVSESQLRD